MLERTAQQPLRLERRWRHCGRKALASCSKGLEKSAKGKKSQDSREANMARFYFQVQFGSVHGGIVRTGQKNTCWEKKKDQLMFR